MICEGTIFLFTFFIATSHIHLLRLREIYTLVFANFWLLKNWNGKAINRKESAFIQLQNAYAYIELSSTMHATLNTIFQLFAPSRACL